MKAARRTTKTIMRGAASRRCWRWPLALGWHWHLSISLFHDLPALAAAGSDPVPVAAASSTSTPVQAPDSQAPAVGCHCLCHMTAQAICELRSSPPVYFQQFPLSAARQDAPRAPAPVCLPSVPPAPDRARLKRIERRPAHPRSAAADSSLPSMIRTKRCGLATSRSRDGIHDPHLACNRRDRLRRAAGERWRPRRFGRLARTRSRRFPAWLGSRPRRRSPPPRRMQRGMLTTTRKARSN